MPARDPRRPKATNPIKDQSGVSASSQFLARTGEGTFRPRSRGRFFGRKYQTIRREYYEQIIAVGECLRCCSPLSRGSHPAYGGMFYKCSKYGHECYNIGLQKDGQGSELIVSFEGERESA